MFFAWFKAKVGVKFVREALSPDEVVQTNAKEHIPSSLYGSLQAWVACLKPSVACQKALVEMAVSPARYG